MPPPAPSSSALRRRIVPSAWAGTIAAGGSLMGLAAAIAADVAGIRTSIPLWIWLTATLSAVALAVRHGFPDSLGGGRGLAGRVLGAVVAGAVIAAAVAVPIVVIFPRPAGDLPALTFSGAAGLAFLCLAIGHLRSPRFKDVPAGPGGLLPAPSREEGAAAYALAAAGPALPAEETEGPAPAVEIRVLWGDDPIRVHHLSPPRAFSAGEAGADLAVDTEPFGAVRLPLVLAAKDGVSVIAPRGATGMIQVATPPRHVAIEQAVAEGLAEPFDGVPGGARIALAPGTRVTMALPSRAAGTAYRGAHDGGEGARVVLEIALVRAGRAVGREVSAARAARSLALAALALGALVGLPALMKPPLVAPDPDDDGMSSDQMYFIAQSLQAATERGMDELEREGLEPDPHMNPPTYARDLWDPERDGYRESSFLPERVLEETPFGAVDEVTMLGPGYFCQRFAWGHGDEPNAEDFRGAGDTTCVWPVATPFGLRSTAALAAPRDLLGRDPSDLWLLEYGRARQRTPPGRVARALAAAATVSVTLDPRPSGSAITPEEEIAIRRHARDFRRCYELGLATSPVLAGSVDLRLAVGLDGRVRARAASTSTLPDPRVRRCVAEAVEGTRVAPRSPPLHEARFRVDLRRGETQPGAR